MSSIYDNAKTDRQYSASTGLKIREFNTLYSVFEQYYIPKKAEDNPYAKPPVLQDKKEALFFRTTCLKNVCNLREFGFIFWFFAKRSA